MGAGEVTEIPVEIAEGATKIAAAGKDVAKPLGGVTKVAEGASEVAEGAAKPGEAAVSTKIATEGDLSSNATADMGEFIRDQKGNTAALEILAGPEVLTQPQLERIETQGKDEGLEAWREAISPVQNGTPEGIVPDSQHAPEAGEVSSGGGEPIETRLEKNSTEEVPGEQNSEETATPELKQEDINVRREASIKRMKDNDKQAKYLEKKDPKFRMIKDEIYRSHREMNKNLTSAELERLSLDQYFNEKSVGLSKEAREAILKKEIVSVTMEALKKEMNIDPKNTEAINKLEIEVIARYLREEDLKKVKRSWIYKILKGILTAIGAGVFSGITQAGKETMKDSIQTGQRG